MKHCHLCQLDFGAFDHVSHYANRYFVIQMYPGLGSAVLFFCRDLTEFCSFRTEQSQIEHLNHLSDVSELYQSTCLNRFPFGSSTGMKE